MVSESLVVNRSGRVVFLEIPDHITEQAVRDIGIVSAGHHDFVSDGPHDNRRIVFQPLECRFRSVHAEFIEHRLGIPNIIEAQRVMTFKIGFCHDVNAVFVGEPVEVGIVAVMRGADAVDVVPLHKPDVFLCGCMRNRLAVKQISLMPVHTLDPQRLPVDPDGIPVLRRHAVIGIDFCGCKADLAEAELCGDGFDDACAVFQRQHECVEIRMLRRPERRLEDLLRDLCFSQFAGTDGGNGCGRAA